MTRNNISFIIPAYNCENTIAESVDSIFNDNFSKGDEVVIVDDASTDQTSKILIHLKNKYKYIKIFKHHYNKGGGAARNTAVENARNELIFCLDSDNILVTQSISKLLNYYIDNNYKVVSFSSIRYFRKSLKTESIWIYDKGHYEFNDHLLTAKLPSSSGNYLFSKLAWADVNGYPEFAQALDTWGFGLNLSAKGYDAYVLPDSYYYHRVHADSYWVTSSKKINYSIIALQLLIPHLDKIDDRIVKYLMKKSNRVNWLNKLPLKISFIERIKRIIN